MKTAKKYNPDLILHGNLIHAILSLAIPVVINSFLQTMYNLTDTYWLGKIGTEQLAAINLVTPMQNIITNFGSGITVAGAVLIAQYIGAGEKEDARSMANQIFICAMGFAVVCAALCFLGTPAIVNWLGADGGTAYYARVYLRVVIWGYAIFVYGEHILRGAPGAGRYGETYVIEPGRHYAESVPGSVFYDHSGYGNSGGSAGDTFGKSSACYGGIYTFVQTGK